MALGADELFVLAETQGVPSRKGRHKADLTMEYVRDIGMEELEALATLAPSNPQPLLRQTRQTHHRLAKLVAEGRKDVDTARLSGFTPQSIYLLKQDPAFQELVEHYKAQTDEIYQEVHEKLANIGQDAIEIIHERLLDNPNDFSNGALMNLAEMALDRSTAPKKTQAGTQGLASLAPGQVNIAVQFIQPAVEPPSLAKLAEGPKVEWLEGKVEDQGK